MPEIRRYFCKQNPYKAYYCVSIVIHVILPIWSWAFIWAWTQNFKGQYIKFFLKWEENAQCAGKKLLWCCWLRPASLTAWLCTEASLPVICPSPGEDPDIALFLYISSVPFTYKINLFKIVVLVYHKSSIALQFW